MTHYRMLDRTPSVAITSNRNELKVYQGNVVYLNNGDNFELRFFNPLQEKIGVEIIFNGIKKGDSYLVLNPGQDILLDRFLDEKRKMLFETYVIDGNNKEAVKAAEKNGLITFNFYKEHYHHLYDYNDIKINYKFPKRGTFGASGTSGASGVSGVSGASSITNASSKLYSKSFTSPGIFLSQSDLSQDYWFPTTTSSGNITFDSLSMNPLETGRVEMGDISNQNLRTVNAQFESTQYHSLTYQILPYSEMNRNITEIRQYCSECGYRLRKKNWKYCPKCGYKLD